MKKAALIAFVVAVVALVTRLAIASNSDFDIHCTAKKVDEAVKKASDGGANTTKEHWQYEVTVENRTFKEIDNLEVKYAIFYKKEKLGVKADPIAKHENGSYTISAIKPHEKKSFTTNSVELSKANLVGNWHYSSGAKPNAQDTLVGLAVRLNQNGQQVADYANPSTLSKEKWD